MEAMKQLLTNVLCLTLILDLSLGALPARAEGSNSPPSSVGTSVTSPAAFLKAVQEESESIFGKNGCAKINDKGEISIVSRTTSSGIQSDQEASVADCEARIKAHIPRAQKALALTEEFKEKSGSGKLASSTCSNCDTPVQAGSDDAIPPGGMCSKNEKLKLEKLRASNPQCSIGCELKGSLKKTAGSLGGLVSSSPSCNVEKAGTSAFGCLKDFVVSLFTSLGTMGKAVWEGVKSAGRWVAGLFSSHKAVEQNATQTSGVFANMSDAEIAAAQKNPAKANQTLLGKVGGALNWVMENIVGLDTPTYSEMWGCAKCGERIAIICKLSGVLGKDIIKNAILIWVGGKALGGLAKLGKAALGGLKATGGVLGKGILKTASGRVMVNWGAKVTASVSSKSAIAFETFMKTGAGKASATVAKLGVKGTVKTLKVAATVFEKLDNAMMYFPRLFVRGGKTVAAEIKAIGSRAGVFKATPRLTAEEAAETGLKKITEVNPNAPLEVEVPNPMTPEMSKAKTAIESKWVGKNKGVTEDIENAVEQSVETSRLKIENPDKVNNIFTYNEGRNALVRMDDGTTLILKEGKEVGKVPAKEAKVVDQFMGAEQRQADELALQNMKKNAQENGLNVSEANSTPKIPQNEFKVNSGPECGNQNIIFSAGRAI